MHDTDINSRTVFNTSNCRRNDFRKPELTFFTNNSLHLVWIVVGLAFVMSICVDSTVGQKPSRIEIIKPIRNSSFSKDGKCRTRKVDGKPRKTNGYFVFDGSADGNLQVDPQIAVGGGYVLHATNNGIVIFDKQGKFVDGVRQNCFNGGIDPKLFFDRHNRVFGFDLWKYWDKEKQKPVNISISETEDPRGAWNTYPVPAPGGRDGGAIGYSKKWIGYSFPGGPEQTFVMKMSEAKSGKPASVYHFAGNLGHPVLGQDDNEELYFFKCSRREFILNKVSADADGNPTVTTIAKKPHKLKYNRYPPKSPQKGTDKTSSSGDRNPKNVVLQNGHIWFCQAVNCEGRSAVQWHELKMDGSTVQTGLIRHSKNNYIQTTIAVNKNGDVLIGFQEAGPDMFISPRFTFRKATDELGTTRPVIDIGTGAGATAGGPWGDYSGSVVDGDNMNDLWTIQSIAGADGKGDTVIAKLPIEKE